MIDMSVCIGERIEMILAPPPNRTHHTFAALWASCVKRNKAIISFKHHAMRESFDYRNLVRDGG